MLHHYGSEEWWGAARELLPRSVELPSPLKIGLVDTSTDDPHAIVRTSTMMWTPESGFNWVLGAVPPLDLQLIRPTEIAAGDLMMRLSASEILEATAIAIDENASDVLGIAGRATHKWAGLESASCAIQCDVINSPFGDVTIYLCADRGVLCPRLRRPSTIDGVMKLEYNRLLLFTTAQRSRVSLLDQYDEAAFDFAAMSVVEACLSQAANDSLPGSRVFEVLNAFGALRTSPEYRAFVDALDDITVS